MNKYGYIYCTTNQITGEKYIGQHKSKEWNYKYFGSGTLIKLAVKRYGIENFKCSLLSWCYDKDELNQLEIDYIKHYNPEYNLTKGGSGIHRMYGKSKYPKRYCKLCKKEIKRYVANNVSGYCKKCYCSLPERIAIYKTEKFKRKQSESHKGQVPWNKGLKGVQAAWNKGFKGEKNHNSGKHWYNDGVKNVYDFECPDGFVSGRLKRRVA